MKSILFILSLVVACTDAPPGASFAPAPSPSSLMITPGYVGPVAPLTMVNDRAVAMWLGQAPRDIYGKETLTVAWRQIQPAAASWAEMAVAVGDPILGNQPLVVVGIADVRQQAGWLGTVMADIDIWPGVDVAQGQGLWLVFATHSATGIGPTVVGGLYPDPISGGVVAAMSVPDWRPSLNIGSPSVFDAQPATRPVIAAVATWDVP